MAGNTGTLRSSSPETVPPTRSATDLAGELRRLLREAEAREEKSISRGGLAKRIGVSQSSLYAYLSGTTLIPGDALSASCAAWMEGLELYQWQGHVEDSARAQRQLQELERDAKAGAGR